MSDKFEFQTEVSELLNLMAHSLYSNKEIFLRELISNASDALDKLNYLCLTNDDFKNLKYEPKIQIKINKKDKILSIIDNGIGMNIDDLKTNLGTIAKSGTKAFMSNLSGDAKKDSSLIGQFGVGFYSAFMVADKIEVLSKKANEENANLWISSGASYEISESKKEEHGTEINLYLKDDEFLESYRLESIIKKYSNHIPYKIFMDKDEYVPPKDDKEEGTYVSVNSQINKATALWSLNKNSIKEEEYEEFYNQISHDSQKPLAYFHTKAEGKIEYNTLFYIPSVAPFDLFRTDFESGVKLYVKRVFITDDNKELLPNFLRFIRGIIDVEDLPLNVSREILQENNILRSVKEQSVSKILNELSKILKNDREKYEKFYNIFGKVLKEGLYGFSTNKEKILDLVLYKNLNDDKLISLDEYKQNMKEGQKSIYYITGNVLKNSILLEGFKAKGINVLLMDDDVDTVIMPMIDSYKEINFKSLSHSDADNEFEGDELKEDELINTLTKMREILSNDVKDVKLSKRLQNSPCCIVFDKEDPDFAYQNILKQMGQENLSNIKPILQINPNHEIFKKLEKNPTMIQEISKSLLCMAMIDAGISIKDPSNFSKNLSEIILRSLN